MDKSLDHFRKAIPLGRDVSATVASVPPALQRYLEDMIATFFYQVARAE